MTRKSPAFAGRAFLFRVSYAGITDASNKEEKHGRTVSASHYRAGAEAAGAGNWGEQGAWVERVKRLINRVKTKNPSVVGSGGVRF